MKHGYFGNDQNIPTIFCFLDGAFTTDDFAFDLLQLVRLISDEQFIAVDDIRLAVHFIMLEGGLGQTAVDVIDIVFAREVARLHCAVHASGRISPIFLALVAEARLEEEVPSVDLVAFPLT